MFLIYFNIVPCYECICIYKYKQQGWVYIQTNLTINSKST